MPSLYRTYSFAAPRQLLSLLQFHVQKDPLALPRLATRCQPLQVSSKPAHQAFLRGSSGQFHRTQSERFYGTSSRSTRKQFVISSNNPSDTTKDDVLKEISRLNEQSSISENDDAAIAILTTPRFAPWMGDSESFLSNLLDIVFRHRTSPRVSVLSAVVDALPSSDQPSDGIAIFSSTPEALPGLLEVQGPKLSSSEQKEASLVFSFKMEPPRSFPMEVEVPLANTLFVNGKLSTLEASCWEKDSETGKFVPASYPIPKPSQVIVIDVHEAGSNSVILVPAVPLTVPRRIEAALGNIVRQVIGKNGKPVPASQELEGIVEAYFAATNQQKQPVSVWALVIPENLMEESSMHGVDMLREEEVCSMWTSDQKEGQWIGQWLRKGARLHKVLSGGGGWGLKAGLLSLDPESTYASATSTEDAFNSPLDSIDIFANRRGEQGQPSVLSSLVQESPLGNVATPGAYIQFFIDPDLDHSTGVNLKERRLLGKDAVVLGTIYPTIDSLPVSSDSDMGSKSGKSYLTVQDGLFGALTQSAVYITDASSKSVNQSKISFPSARLRWSAAA